MFARPTALLASLAVSVSSASACCDVLPGFDPMAGFWGAYNEENCGDYTTENCGEAPRNDQAGAREDQAGPVLPLSFGEQAAPAGDVVLRFRPDRRQRREQVRALRASIAEQSPEDAGVLDSADVFRTVGVAVRPFGMSTDDLADTSTLFLIELFDAANDTSTRPTVGMTSAISDQMTRAYAALGTPALRDSAKVQEQSDVFVLQAWLISSIKRSLEEGGGSREDRVRFRSAMADFAKDFYGIDLTRATIDERGLTPGEALDALDGAVREDRAKRAAADPEGEAKRVVAAALGTPCGVEPRDRTERKLLALFEGRGRCDAHDPVAYARFLDDVPADQHYAINYVAWSSGKPLYPADQAKMLDGMIE